MMQLTGTHFASARRRQKLTVADGDRGTVHGLCIVIERGPVEVRLGSTEGAQDIIRERTLGRGEHIISFTPTADVWIELSHKGYDSAYVTSVEIVEPGAMVIGDGYDEDDLALLRTEQSGDVVYIACFGRQQMKLSRHATLSWSFEEYLPTDGPFRLPNLKAITIEPSDVQGDVTLEASEDIFDIGHIGALFRLASVGQVREDSITAEDQFTSSILVTGQGSARNLAISLTGTFVADITLQRSVGDDQSWEDVTTYNAVTVTTYNDALDDQIIYYRVGVKTGDFTSGTITAVLRVTTGSISGVARITDWQSGSLVGAQVLVPFGSTTPTEDWEEGLWSTYRGFPSAVALHDGRLWWAGKQRFVGSVSDDYESFDDGVEGDSGPINRTIGRGPVDNVNWIAPVQRLILGTDGAEFSVRGSQLDGILTPTDLTLKPASTQGSGAVGAQVVDSSVMFVQACGQRLYALEPATGQNRYDYDAIDMTALAPEVGAGTSALPIDGFTRLGVQRQPNTRVHAVRSDGTVALLIYNKLEELRGWVTVSAATGYTIEDVCVLPGVGEDQVYYLLKNEDDDYFLVKWAKKSEAVGGELNKQADLFVAHDGAPISSLTGLSHLNGQTVVVWADGEYLDDVTTVAGGACALGGSYSKVCVGLAYTARFKSSKLSKTVMELFQRKRVNRLGVLLKDTHKQGLQFGPDFDHLDDLPPVEDGTTVAAGYVWDAYDKDMLTFNGGWDPDSRLCLTATAPKPCTVVAAVIDTETGFLK